MNIRTVRGSLVDSWYPLWTGFVLSGSKPNKTDRKRASSDSNRQSADAISCTIFAPVVRKKTEEVLQQPPNILAENPSINREPQAGNIPHYGDGVRRSESTVMEKYHAVILQPCSATYLDFSL